VIAGRCSSSTRGTACRTSSIVDLATRTVEGHALSGDTDTITARASGSASVALPTHGDLRPDLATLWS
jgi:hypothetical protein